MMRVSVHTCASAIMLVALLAGISVAGSVPADPSGSSGAASLPSLMFDSGAATEPAVEVAAAFPTGVGSLAAAGSGVSEAAESSRDWLSTAGYAATAVGLAAGLTQALTRGGSSVSALAPMASKADDALPANDDLPVPEPSALILAALAVSGAVVHLRRRQTA